MEVNSLRMDRYADRLLWPLALLGFSLFLATVVWAQAPASTMESSRAVSPERLVAGVKVYGKHSGVLTASGYPFRIAYSDSQEPRYHFSMFCEGFLTQTNWVRVPGNISPSF
jgi:hypothetical protein